MEVQRAIPSFLPAAEAFTPPYLGTGSTDLWGISFAFSGIDRQDMSSEELARELTVMRACWAFFDEVRSRVSAELQQGPRGNGRDRDLIVRHLVGNEQYWTKKVGGTRAPQPGADRRGIESASRRLLRGHSGVPCPGQNGPNLAAPIPDSAHCVSHTGSRLGNGRQRPHRQTSVSHKGQFPRGARCTRCFRYGWSGLYVSSADRALSFRASTALIVLRSAVARTLFPIVPTRIASSRPLRFFPSRTTTTSTAVVPSGCRVNV